MALVQLLQRNLGTKDANVHHSRNALSAAQEVQSAPRTFQHLPANRTHTCTELWSYLVSFFIHSCAWRGNGLHATLGVERGVGWQQGAASARQGHRRWLGLCSAVCSDRCPVRTPGACTAVCRQGRSVLPGVVRNLHVNSCRLRNGARGPPSRAS